MEACSGSRTFLFQPFLLFCGETVSSAIVLFLLFCDLFVVLASKTLTLGASLFYFGPNRFICINCKINCVLLTLTMRWLIVFFTLCYTPSRITLYCYVGCNSYTSPVTAGSGSTTPKTWNWITIYKNGDNCEYTYSFLVSLLSFQNSHITRM